MSMQSLIVVLVFVVVASALASGLYLALEQLNFSSGVFRILLSAAAPVLLLIAVHRRGWLPYLDRMTG